MTDEMVNNFNKGFLNYFNIFAALMNFLAILITLIIFQKNIFISSFGILFSSVFIIILIHTFIKNNPLYTYYFFGLVIIGFLFTIPLILMGSWLGIIIILDVLYFYKMYRSMVRHSGVSTMSQTRIAGRAGSMGLSVGNLKQTWDNINPDMEKKRRQMKELLEKKYNGKLILRNSLVLSFSLIIIFVLNVIT